MIARIRRAFALLLRTIVYGATTAAAWAAPYAGIYLIALAGTTALWLVLIIGFTLAKALTGYFIFGYIGALLAAVLTLILGLMWTPLAVVIGTLIGVTHPLPAGWTHDPRIVGAHYLSFVGTLLFGELLFSLYVLAVPFHQNLAMLPALIIAGSAVGVGTLLYGGWLGGRFYSGLALGAVALLTLEMFNPGVLALLYGHLTTIFHGNAVPTAVYWILLPVLFTAEYIRRHMPNVVAKGIAGGVELLSIMALIQWLVAGSGAEVVKKYAPDFSREATTATAPRAEPVLPTVPRGVTVFMSPGEEKEYLLQPIGIRLLEGKATVECLACDFPSFYLERERKRGKSNVEFIDVEEYYRQHGTRPSVYHKSVFKIRIKAEGVFAFEAL